MNDAFLKGFADEMNKFAEEKKKTKSWTDKAALGLLLGIPAGVVGYAGLKGPAGRMMKRVKGMKSVKSLMSKKIKHVDFQKLRGQIKDLPTYKGKNRWRKK